MWFYYVRNSKGMRLIKRLAGNLQVNKVQEQHTLKVMQRSTLNQAN